MEENTRENKMGTMPIGKLLANMAGPVMISMLFQALYNIVDSVFVARLSQDAMNAVSLAFPLQTLCIAFAVGTGVGMNALLARSLGEKNMQAVDRAAGTGLFLTLCTAAVFAVLGFSLATPFFRFQTENAQIIAYGSDYVMICIGGSLGLFLQIYGERLLQSTGRTDLSMISQIAGAVCNIVLDPILIFGLLGFPRMEVAGAAVATIVGQFVGAGLGLFLNLKKNPEVQIHLKDIRPHRATVADIYAIGIPSIIMQSIGSVMMFGMNRILISFTEAATAVFGAYFKLQSFIFMPCFGLNNAMVPIVSYNYGAQTFDRVRKTVRLTVFTAIGIMCVGCALRAHPRNAAGDVLADGRNALHRTCCAAHHRRALPARGLQHHRGQRVSGARQAHLCAHQFRLPPDRRAAAGGVSALAHGAARACVACLPDRGGRERHPERHVPAAYIPRLAREKIILPARRRRSGRASYYRRGSPLL